MPVWGRRLLFLLIPSLLTCTGVLWADREQKVKVLNDNVTNLSVLSVRVDGLEREIKSTSQASFSQNQQVLTELYELRKEVKEMYRRAIAAGGKQP